MLRYDYHNPALIRRWGRYAESILDDDDLLDVVLHDDKSLKLFASDKRVLMADAEPEAMYQEYLAESTCL